MHYVDKKIKPNMLKLLASNFYWKIIGDKLGRVCPYRTQRLAMKPCNLRRGKSKKDLIAGVSLT